MPNASIPENLAAIEADIAAAAGRHDRLPAEVTLVAVSKTVDIPAIKAAYAAGQRHFAENRSQELERKVPRLPDDCQWHMIGHLQANKVRPTVILADWIDSVDSVPLIERLDRIAGEEARQPSFLLQFNIAGETTKSGASPAAADALLEAALACRHAVCRGLMTMAPFDASPEQLATVFAGLRQLRDRLVHHRACQLPVLSMGMSGDFQAAIAQGATMVRIGAAIFGDR